jgi:hypothetical protein
VFEAIGDRHNGYAGGLRGDHGARGRAERTKVRSGGRRRQVSAKVELRPEEDDPEEQGQKADAVSLGLHVMTKTKLRWERLWGQGRKPSSGEHLYTILDDGI